MPIQVNLREPPLVHPVTPTRMTGLFNPNAFWVTYSLSVASASIAEFVTYPLDLTKTRLQIQGEIAAKALSSSGSKQNLPYRGMVTTGYGIIVEEGFLNLWRGVTPALARHCVYSGTRMLMYDKLRQILGVNEDGSIAFWKSVLGGVTAGAFAQFLASPTDLVKVQIMMEGKRRLLGEPPRVTGPMDAFRKIYKAGGFRGLWKGSIPNVQRAALVNLGDLTTYDMAKSYIVRNTTLGDSYLTHFLGSVCAGFLAAVLGTPADVVKTRVMNQPTDERGRGLLYKSSYDCFKKTVQNEGFFAMYKGFIPLWIRLGPWSLIFWMTFEEFKKMVGANQF